MLKAFSWIIWRDLILLVRRRSEWVTPLLFFVMTLSLFPIALGFQPKTLSLVAPAVLWVVVLLAILMSLENLFRLDFQEGTIEQLILSPFPLPILLLGKSIAHFLTIGIPLIILAPFFALLFQMTTAGTMVLMLTLILGIPALSLFGSVGAALTVGLHQGGLLLSVLVLPFMMPIIIFGSSAVTAANEALPFTAELLFLLALLLFALLLAPVITAMSLRASLE